MNNSSDLNKKSIGARGIRSEHLRFISGILVCSTIMIAPVIAFGSVESSLAAVQEKLVGTLLPLAAMCGLVVAGLSFVAGHPNARSHLVYAIIGAIVGFGSESIVSFIRGLIH
jgi:type IV secretory pathway VirB2 component (pilin)